MARQIRDHSNNGEDEVSSAEEYSWLLTYSDMITLLLAFFAMYIGISNVDMNLFEQFKQGLRAEVQATDRQTPLIEVKHDLDSLLSKQRKAGTVDISLGPDGIIMQFYSSSFYNQGEAELLPAGQRIIDIVLNALTNEKMERYGFNIGVQGHTDPVPIETERFPSNWELSAARASNVVKYFIQQGIPSHRLKAAGYADTRPLVPNKDAQGNYIPENMAKNRRITLRIFYARELQSQDTTATQVSAANQSAPSSDS